LSHKHRIKKTQITLLEYDDVKFYKLAIDPKYYGECNSKNRTLEFNFEYCLDCDLRLLNGKAALTRGILDDEFEAVVEQARRGNCKQRRHLTVQHSDFELLERLIAASLKFGKLRAKMQQKSGT
jgi:hypothetical protein